MKVGFIGLGQMGQAMAGRLLEAGHELTVYNRSRAATEPLRSRGARVAEDPLGVLDGEVVITSTSFNAPAYKSYGRRIVEKDFEPTFALSLGLKDVELALDAGADTRVPLPTADLIREQHLAAIARGFGEKDWAALGEYISERAGL